MTVVEAPKRYEAFTLEHFKAYASRVVLDTGYPCDLEDFQVEIVRPILAGVKETWIIIPEGNAKTTLMALVALYHCDYTREPWVPIAASSRDQAEILARQAYGMVRNTPGMSRRFRIFEGYREIRSLNNAGRGIKVYAADTSSADGVIPTLAICDEGHRWNDLSLYRLWHGKLKKRRGQIVMISTAGEPGSDFEETRDAIRDKLPNREQTGAYLRAWKTNLEFHEWMVRDPSKYTNIAAVKEANPFSYIEEDELEEELLSPTTDHGDWKRLKCNIPSRKKAAAITETEWNTCETGDQIPAGARVDVGADVAWRLDTFAIQPAWMDLAHNRRILGEPIILTPPPDGSQISVDEVKQGFMDINDCNPIDAVVMDTSHGKDIQQWLEDELGVAVIDRGQGNALQSEDYEELMQAIRATMVRSGQARSPAEAEALAGMTALYHTGDAALRRHVMNAIARQLPGDKTRFDRPSQSRARRKQSIRVIDALTAAGLVNWYQSNFEVEPELLVGWR